MSIDDLQSAIRTVPDFPKPGIQFKDLTPLLADPELCEETVRQLAQPFSGAGITHVAGIEARGFWFGPALALRLEAGFVPVRKPGKLPGETVRETYALEYGEDALELHSADLPQDASVLVHDDVIATGGTAAATARLVEACGARVVGFSFVLELENLKGRDQLAEGALVRALLRDEG